MSAPAAWRDVEWLTLTGRRKVRVLASVAEDETVSVEGILENVKPLHLRNFSGGERLCLYGAVLKAAKAETEATQVLPPPVLTDDLDGTGPALGDE